MTIEQQNAINATYPRPIPQDVTVQVQVSLPPSLVTRVVHYLDANREATWDTVAQDALENFLDTMGQP